MIGVTMPRGRGTEGAASDMLHTDRATPPSHTGPRPWARLVRLVAGDDERRRFSLRMWMLSVASYVAYVAALWVQVALGYADAAHALALGSMVALGNLAFYALIRTGLIERRDWRTRAAMVQLVFGIAMMLANYAVSGPAATATTIIMASHVIYAAFTIDPTRIWWLAATSLAALGAVMAGGAWLAPDRFEPGLQLVAFLYAAIVVPLVARLARTITTLQTELRDRTGQLRATLAELEHRADHDDLTGLLNRRRMTTLLADATAEGGWCLALLDLDHFKAINDRHGHGVGDRVLAEFAATATASLRDGDLLARWGGEEFLLALHDATVDQARHRLGRLADALDDGRFLADHPEVEVRFSAGLVAATPGATLHDLLERADEALYRAKAGGRARVELALVQ